MSFRKVTRTSTEDEIWKLTYTVSLIPVYRLQLIYIAQHLSEKIVAVVRSIHVPGLCLSVTE